MSYIFTHCFSYVFRQKMMDLSQNNVLIPFNVLITPEKIVLKSLLQNQTPKTLWGGTRLSKFILDTKILFHSDHVTDFLLLSVIKISKTTQSRRHAQIHVTLQFFSIIFRLVRGSLTNKQTQRETYIRGNEGLSPTGCVPFKWIWFRSYVFA